MKVPSLQTPHRADSEAAVPRAFQLARLTLAGNPDGFSRLPESGVNSMEQDEDPRVAAARVNFRHSSTGATPLMVAAGKGRLHEVVLHDTPEFGTDVK